MSTIGNYLEMIGIAGWGELEPAMMCALKTETPINLIGNKGTSKTEFAYRISRALLGSKCNFQKYDTPDATLDQILGFPDISKMQHGEIDFIKTGTSIWNKNSVLWDEPNRASPMFQGKLLEVVRTGTIHGKKTDVRFQFAACNPPRKTANSVGHDVHFLGDAFASRFFHMHVPDTSVALYDAALRLSGVRDAFDNNDTVAIGKYCAPFANFWLDFSNEAPTAADTEAASKVVRAVLAECIKNGYFDMRAALRATVMLSELLVLNRVQPLDGALIPGVERIITGNIAELNGVIRNDRSGDAANIKAIVRQHAQAFITGSMSKASVNLISAPYSMIQGGKFDELSISGLISSLKSQPGLRNIETVLSSLVKKVQVDNKYRAVLYRSGHKKVIQSVLEYAQSFGHNSFSIKSFDGAIISVDTENGAAVAATDVHNQWFKLCGLSS